MKWKTGIVCLMIISLFTLHAWCDEPRDISENNEYISMDFTNVDIKRVITSLLNISNMDSVIDECVRGKVTLQTDRVPFYEGFRIFLNYTGLDYEQEGNLIRIYCKADSTAITDLNETKALPGIRARVFASFKEKGKAERETLLPKMDREFSDSLILLLPYKEKKAPSFFLWTLDQNGHFISKSQYPIEIRFSLVNLLPKGVEVKISFSYTEKPEVGADFQEYRTISGTRKKLITSSNVDEPILLLSASDGNEYYLSVIPEEWSQ